MRSARSGQAQTHFSYQGLPIRIALSSGNLISPINALLNVNMQWWDICLYVHVYRSVRSYVAAVEVRYNKLVIEEGYGAS